MTLPPVPRPPRIERSGVEFPSGAWTSFDRYARYAAIVRSVRANLGSGPWRVLDVGDNSGYLLTFDPELVSIAADVAVNEQRLDGTRAILADGRALPVPSGGVDAVVSSDALEHVPPLARPAFLAELVRASGDLVVLAAPFDTPGVAGAEEFTRRFVEAVTGAPQQQLDEHAEHGLPSLDETVACLTEAGMHVDVRGNGNLYDWLVGMVGKHDFSSSPSFGALDSGFDVLYNLSFAGVNDTPPFYRHVIVARRSQQPVPETTPDGPALGDTVPPGLLAALVAASAAAAARRDVLARLDSLADRVAVLEVQAQTAHEHFMRRFEGIEAALASLLEQVGSISDQVAHLSEAARHPVRTVGNLVRRRGTSGDDDR